MGICTRIITICTSLLLPAAALAHDTTSPAPKFERVGACKAEFLEGILPDKKGGFWMLDVEGDRVLHWEPGKGCSQAGTVDWPSGQKYAPDGSITIVGKSGVYRFDPATGKSTVLESLFEGKQLTGLNDIVYDKKGGFYATAPGDSSALSPVGRVYYRAADGKVTLLAGGLAYPDGVALSEDGNTVIISELAKKLLLSLPAAGRGSGTPMVQAYSIGGLGPDGMTFLPDGRLIFANCGASSIGVMDTSNRIKYFRLPADAGIWPTNITIVDGTLYLVEAKKGEIWKIALSELTSDS